MVYSTVTVQCSAMWYILAIQQYKYLLFFKQVNVLQSGPVQLA